MASLTRAFNMSKVVKLPYGSGLMSFFPRKNRRKEDEAEWRRGEWGGKKKGEKGEWRKIKS